MGKAGVAWIMEFLLIAVGSVWHAPALVGASGSHPETPGSLDGTRWAIALVPDQPAAAQGERAFREQVVFRDGEVVMTASRRQRGFRPSPYRAIRFGDAWSFSTEQVSGQAGWSEWSATIQGNVMRGMTSWRQPNGAVIRYTFQGTRQP